MIGRVLHFFRGTVTFSAENGFPERLLMRCGKEELLLFNVKANETGFRASCLFREYAQVEALAEVCGVTVTRISEQGLPLKLARYRWRFMLPCGILLVLFLLALSQSFLWTIEVRGNRDVSAEAIRMIMAEEGYSKMTFLPNKDLRMTCQNVMLKLPQLSFITINRYGSRLEVIVAERTLKTEIHSEEPCDIVAAQDGVVRSIEVYQGEKATGAGYAVSAGEVLAHGHYQTKKGQIMLVHADAKVIAEVFFEKTISIDLNEVAVEYTGEESEETSLYLFSLHMPLSARKRQNALYEETITERPLRLFGKEFPFGTVTSHKQYYRLMDEETAQKSGEEQLRRAFLQYEAEKLSDSAILSREEHFSKKGSVLSLTVRYTAERNIAQTVPVTMREFTVQPENS